MAQVQTFLPVEDFRISSQQLDYKRLGKQRVETWQILRSLTIPGYGWSSHPAVKMWKGYEEWLIFYGIENCLEWRKRGYRDSMLERFTSALSSFEGQPYPTWLGDERFHASHRANLLRKDESFYRTHGWTDNPSMPYHWPR